MVMGKYKVLGVCQGQGALLFPLKKHLVANIEPRGCFHTPGEEQWKINFGNIPFVRTVAEVEDKLKDIDIIISSPNCGSSSILSYSRRKKLGKPKEDPTISLFLNSIKEIKPKLFLMENLPKLLDFIPISEWEENFPDYEIIYHCGSVSQFGNSQISRVRLILIGIKKGQASFNKNQFTRIFKVKQLKFTRSILESARLLPKFFPMNGNIRELPMHKVCMYDWRDPKKEKLTLLEIKRLWTGDFSDCYKWPINSPRMKTLPGVYRNNHDRYPMTARKADRQFRPDGEIMSPAELAVIQGFPRRYKIYCIDTNEVRKRNYWINKGRVTITKGPSYEIGVWFRKCLKNI